MALIAFVPGGDVGIAVILLTIGIRLVLLPLSLSAARAQRAMKLLEPKLKELKEKHKDDKEKEAVETLALYREAEVNPFASILTALIQIPVVLALYWVFLHEPFVTPDVARLYALTPLPHIVTLQFFGLFSVAGKSLTLAIIAGLTQFFQAHLALSGTMKPSGDGMQGDFQRVMGTQLKYVFPFLIAAISYTTSSAIALYLIATNLAMSLQELYVRKTLTAEDLKKELQRVAPK